MRIVGDGAPAHCQTMRLHLIILIFGLTDFALIAAYQWDDPQSASAMLLIDYVYRIVILALIFQSAEMRRQILTSFSNERSCALASVRDFGWLFILYILIVVITASLRMTGRATGAFDWAPPLFAYSHAVPMPLALFDLTIGLMLVAITEELFFRKILLDRLRARGWMWAPAILLSATLFAFIHWGAGGASVANAAVFGLVWGAFYWRRGRIGALIVWHYLANLHLYS